MAISSKPTYGPGTRAKRVFGLVPVLLRAVLQTASGFVCMTTGFIANSTGLKTERKLLDH